MAVHNLCLNLKAGFVTYLRGGRPDGRLFMSQWHDSMVDQPESGGGLYVAGWTISGLAVLGTIVAVWVLGI
jgi:hypothetical protein